MRSSASFARNLVRPGRCPECRADLPHPPVRCVRCGAEFRHVRGLRAHLEQYPTLGARARSLVVEHAVALLRGWPPRHSEDELLPLFLGRNA